MTGNVEPILASGVERAEIEALLRDAEPKRVATLSASLNLTVAIFLVVLGAPLRSGLLLPFVAAIVACSVWALSNRLWRDIALAAVAQKIGERWGQSHFASGWGDVDFEKAIADIFSHEGARFTAWESQGRYRDVAYRLSEVTLWRRRRHEGRREVVHFMRVEIAVPHAFSGCVDLLPKAGFIGAVDDFFRSVSGDEMQRQAVDPQFDAVFDTLANANASVEQLLTPGFRTAMLALAERHPHSRLSARFEHGWFSLSLPIPHVVFGSARLLKPMVELIDDADMLWWDLTVSHRLIDSLMGGHQGPLR